MSAIHVLNGDSLYADMESTQIHGDLVVCREYMIDGPATGDTIDQIFKTRASFIESHYAPKGSYQKDVATEFNKILHAPIDTEFNLWFGYDLFCQANMWFVLWILQQRQGNDQIYVVYPSYLSYADRWKDFGRPTSRDINKAFEQRIRFNKEDLALGVKLWLAYQQQDLKSLGLLSKISSSCFPYLEEVCAAHIDRFPKNGIPGRPERVVTKLLKEGHTDFSSLFNAFWQTEGVYGFGDTQVKEIMDNLTNR